MKLLRLTLDHFKGIEHYDLRLDGGNASIYGDNATGKTTLYDGFLWLLFSKDSSGRQDFAIKPLGLDGKPAQSGVEVHVRAELMVEGQPVVLEKAYREKWEKKRGAAVPEMTGHTVEHWIDGLPVPQSAYKAAVDKLIPEKLFRMLTSTTYFGASLSWQERRKTLFELCGGVTEEHVFQAHPELAPLQEAKGRHTAEEYRKILQSQRNAANKELDQLPARIDETRRSVMPQEVPADAQERLEGLQAQRQALGDRLSQSGGAALAAAESDAQAAISALRELEERNRRRHLEQELAYNKALEARMAPLKRELDVAEREARRQQGEIEAQARRAQRLDQEMEELRAAWRKLDGEQWRPGTVCPTCGQAIPTAKLEAARQEWEAHKAEQLKAIQAAGKQKAQQKQECLKEIDAAETAMEDRQAEAEALYEAIETQRGMKADIADLPEYSAELERLTAARDRAKRAVEAARQDEAARSGGIREQMRDVDRQLAQLQEAVAVQAANARCAAREQELLERQRDVGAELERLDGLIALCEAYTRAMVEVTEQRVDGLFRRVRFKLFDRQINGGLAETCVPCVDGVPYADLNHAAQINAGLDIIQALITHYGQSAPVWVDNAESVARLDLVEAQQIRLVVSAADKELRVELEAEEERQSA